MTSRSHSASSKGTSGSSSSSSSEEFSTDDEDYRDYLSYDEVDTINEILSGQQVDEEQVTRRVVNALQEIANQLSQQTQRSSPRPPSPRPPILNNNNNNNYSYGGMYRPSIYDSRSPSPNIIPRSPSPQVTWSDRPSPSRDYYPPLPPEWSFMDGTPDHIEFLEDEYNPDMTPWEAMEIELATRRDPSLKAKGGIYHLMYKNFPNWTGYADVPTHLIEIDLQTYRGHKVGVPNAPKKKVVEIVEVDENGRQVGQKAKRSAKRIRVRRSKKMTQTLNDWLNQNSKFFTPPSPSPSPPGRTRRRK